MSRKGRGRAVAEGLNSAPAESFALRDRRSEHARIVPRCWRAACVEEGVDRAIAQLNRALSGVDA
jgi:hypothetical protein